MKIRRTENGQVQIDSEVGGIEEHPWCGFTAKIQNAGDYELAALVDALIERPVCWLDVEDYRRKGA